MKPITASFSEAVEDITREAPRTPQSAFLKSGSFPIVDQGHRLVAGYVDDESSLCRASPPVMLFGDHTRTLKYVDFPFAVGADGVKILRAREDWYPKYVFHYLNSQHIPNAGYSRHFKFLKELTVPKPPLDEQRRIAAILDQADALRTKRRRSLTLLEDMRQSIFLEMFGDPVRNECDWPMRAFGDVCQTRLGKMLDAKQQTGTDSRPYLRNANVQWFRLELDDVYEMDFDEKSRATLRLQDGDLLICEGGHPGRAAVWRGELKDCYFQKALHRARPHPGVALSDFLAQLLWFVVHRGGLKDHVTSATIAHLTGAKLKAMPIILPDVTIQAEFVRRIQGLDEYRAVISAQDSALHDLLSSLEARAFSDGLQPNLPSEFSPGG